MKLTENQVREYLVCWVNNYGAQGIARDVVDEAFAYDAALVSWGFKKDRWDEFPEFDKDHAEKVIAELKSNLKEPTP